MSEPHEVVKLLLKRMESHPEEFKKDADRWDRVLVEVLEHADEAEIAAIHASVRNIRLGEAHEDMMEELCNGEERRRKEAEEQEYERNLAKSLQLTQQQAMQQQLQQYQNAVGQRGAYDYNLDRYQNQLGQYNQAQATGIVGKSPSSIWLDESANIGIGTQSPSQPLTIGAGGKEVMRIKADGGVITQPNLSRSAINQIKQALGIKK